MRNKIAVFVALAVVGLSGCSTNETVQLTDGRSFRPTMMENDGGRLQFRANGWDYNLPSYMLTTDPVAERMNIQKVEVTKDSIITPAGSLANFEQLMRFLDKKATRTSPVIVVLPDSMSWSEARRQEFGMAYGEVHLRPNVGMEGLSWPKKWLPGEPGRELPKE